MMMEQVRYADLDVMCSLPVGIKIIAFAVNV